MATTEEDDFISGFKERQLNCDVNNKITLYQQTRDGRYFWRAYVLLQQSGRPIPVDFLAKLAEIGKRLLTARHPSEMASALEFSGDEKNYVGPSTSLAYERRWRIASEVKTVKDLYKESLINAIAVVARNRGLSFSKVKGDYYKVFGSKARAPSQKSASSPLSDVMKIWGQ